MVGRVYVLEDTQAAMEELSLRGDVISKARFEVLQGWLSHAMSFGSHPKRKDDKPHNMRRNLKGFDAFSLDRQRLQLKIDKIKAEYSNVDERQQKIKELLQSEDCSRVVCRFIGVSSKFLENRRGVSLSEALEDERFSPTFGSWVASQDLDGVDFILHIYQVDVDYHIKDDDVTFLSVIMDYL